MPGAEVRIALRPGGFPHDPALETTLADFPVGFPLPLVEAICDVMQARFAPCDQPGSAQPTEGVVLPKGMLTGFDCLVLPKERKDAPRGEFIAKAPRPRRQSDLQQ
ncbi:hypothetical protein [Paracoccus indicus]|uniref:hypothetical protein n=1 Tax=Paracoccus indicus TaxID=2079229 RepID=UPI000D3AABA6|nr:hypothetical protein [Paracoccus indicus]